MNQEPADDELLRKWMRQWLRAHEAGQVLELAMLARERPALLAELESRVARHRAVKAIVNPGSVESPPNRNGGASSGQANDQERLDVTRAGIVSVGGPPAAHASLLPGLPTDDFGDVERLLGVGGHSEVYAVRERKLDRVVAVKVAQASAVGRPADLKRIEHEAWIIAQLDHPGIVPLYRMGQLPDGRPYYAMKRIQEDGASLDRGIVEYHGAESRGWSATERERRLKAMVEALRAAAGTIAFAHARKIVHLDIKPQNILVGRFGETLVVDWGLAMRVETVAPEVAAAHPGEKSVHRRRPEASTMTREGSSSGTPAYMSPEQALGVVDDFSPATDVFLLGATLYKILTGRPPYQSEKQTENLLRASKGQFPTPRSVGAVDPALEAICLKAMQPLPSERYATALELANELGDWLQGRPVAAYPEPLAARTKRFAARHHQGLTVGVILLSIMTVTAIGNSLRLKQLNDDLVQRDAALRDSNQSLERRNLELAESRQKEERAVAQAVSAEEANARLAGLALREAPRFGKSKIPLQSDPDQVLWLDELARFVDSLPESLSEMALESRLNLASNYFAQRAFTKAEPLFRRVEAELIKRGAHLPPSGAKDDLPEQTRLADVRRRLAATLLLSHANPTVASQTPRNEAERRLKDVLKWLETRPDDDADVLETKFWLGCLMVDRMIEPSLSSGIEMLESISKVERERQDYLEPARWATAQSLMVGYFLRGEFDRALQVGREVFDARTRMFGELSMETVVTREWLAMCLFELGHVEEARGHADAIVKLRESLFRNDRESILIARWNALVYGASRSVSTQDQIGVSHQQQTHVWRQKRHEFGEDNPDTVVMSDYLLRNVTVLARHQRLSEMELLNESDHILAEVIRVFGKDSRAFAEALLTQGRLAHVNESFDAGTGDNAGARLARAEAYFKLAQSNFQRTLPRRHPILVDVELELASVESDRSAIDNSLHCRGLDRLRRILDLEEIDDADHAERKLRAIRQLADLLIEFDAVEARYEALALLRQLHDIYVSREEKYSQPSPMRFDVDRQIALCIHRLAEMRDVDNDVDIWSGSVLLWEAHCKQIEYWGESDYDSLVSERWLAEFADENVESDPRALADVIGLHTRALNKFTKKLGDDDREVLEIRHQIGRCRRKLVRLGVPVADEMLRDFRAVYEGRNKVLPRGHADTVDVLLDIAFHLVESDVARDRHEARHCFEESLTLLDAAQSRHKGQFAAAYRGLGRYYRDNENLAEAEGHLRKSVKLLQEDEQKDVLDLFETLVELAMTLAARRKWDEASEHWEEARKLGERFDLNLGWDLFCEVASLIAEAKRRP